MKAVLRTDESVCIAVSFLGKKELEVKHTPVEYLPMKIA